MTHGRLFIQLYHTENFSRKSGRVGGTVMTTNLNGALLRLTKRAETTARAKLIQTFVDVGPLFALLSSHDHQVLFGRRGTGKTHVLNYLADRREKEGDAVAVVDLRNIGSSSGIYGDQQIPLPERGTRLIVDTLAAVHEALLSYFINRAEELDLSQSGPALDALADAITQVKVVGNTQHQSTSTDAYSAQSQSKAEAHAGIQGLGLSVSGDDSHRTDRVDSYAEISSGIERLYVNFGATGEAFRRIATCLQERKLWVLLDEWSSIPLELQPYLADLLRRSIFPITGMTVKIAAIEHRSAFFVRNTSGDYTGIELGADASADANLDDFMVFDNDAEKAKHFFTELVSRHVKAALEELSDESYRKTKPQHLVAEIFTEKRAIEEFVRSCEGVPRDAINILSMCAQRALDTPISVQHVRVAAKNWYQRDKEKVVSSDPKAQTLLHWIVDQVIGERRARAFLLRSDTKSRLIETLYDSRVLHIIKRGISTHDQPGVRYDAYKLDYGCYVDLITTAKAPQGLLPSEESTSEYVDVPPDDYRSIRRAILDLSKFEQVQGNSARLDSKEFPFVSS